ncbi:MAG: hypothetical protein FJ290_27400 [Planctomycetes bacterium]|nr:hypothetical protein [Planctomycetota bacterium]
MSLTNVLAEMCVTSAAERYIADHGLQHAYEIVIGVVSEIPSCRRVAVSLTPYDDFSGVSLVDIELNCGLSGREAIETRNLIYERLRGELGSETANKFLIVVR